MNRITKIAKGIKYYNIPFFANYAFNYIELLALVYFWIRNPHKPGIFNKLTIFPLSLLGIIALYSIVDCLYLGYPIGKSIQQVFFLGVFIYLFSSLFLFYKCNTKLIFTRYLIASYIVVILGFVQIIIYSITGFDIFGLFTWLGEGHHLTERILRFRSICPENGLISAILSPSIVYGFYFKDCWKIYGKKKYILLLAFIMTSSMDMVLTLTLILYVKFIGRHKYLNYIFIGLLIFSASSIATISEIDSFSIKEENIKGVVVRIQGMTSVIEVLDDISAIEMTHPSVYAIAANFYVARHAPNRLIGTGLGTHDQNYASVYPPTSKELYGLNKDDGYSLLNRIFSEFGYIGLFLYLFFILKRVNRKNVVAFSSLFFIICAFVRGGYYFGYGTVFFHYLYFLSSKKKRAKHTITNKHISHLPITT